MFRKVMLFICIISILSLDACMASKSQPTVTPIPPTVTLIPTDTPVPPTATLLPTNTPVPPTATLMPTNTPIPPTATKTPGPGTPSITPYPTRPPYINGTIYDAPGMDAIQPVKLMYPTLTNPSEKLALEICDPTDHQADKLLPVVIIVNLFRLNGEWWKGNSEFLSDYYGGWCRLLAVNGLIGVMYDTNYPDDLDAVVKYLQDNSAKLGVDASRMGLIGASSNGSQVGSFAYQEHREYLKFIVFYYSSFRLPGEAINSDYNNFCQSVGCYYAELPEVKQLRADLPVLVVRAGDDDQIDKFVALAQKESLPLTLIKFDDGAHGFDFSDPDYDKTIKVKAIAIMDQTLEFMKTHIFK